MAGRAELRIDARFRERGGTSVATTPQGQAEETPSRPETPAAEAARLAQVAVGDPAAARAIVDAQAPRVLALATRMLNDRAEAEDVAQEALLRLWRAAPDWRPDGARISTWLHRVTVNLCVDRLRKRGRSTPIDDAPEPVDETPGAAAAMAAEEGERTRTRAVRTALMALPDRQRAAVLLRHYEDRSNPEIADALGVSVEAVESLLARGRRALKAALLPKRADLLDP